MTVSPPVTDCATLFVKSSVPSAQLVLLMVPAFESIVVVPAALQSHVGELLKLVAHCVASTSTEGGSSTCVQLTHVPFWHVSEPGHAVPQPPQLLVSVEKLAHPPLHEL
jgi:hypothetical protein